MMHAEQVTWIGIIVFWKRKEDITYFKLIYYCLVLSWCLILACFCWVLTQTTLVENTRLNAEYMVRRSRKGRLSHLKCSWHTVGCKRTSRAKLRLFEKSMGILPYVKIMRHCSRTRVGQGRLWPVESHPLTSIRSLAWLINTWKGSSQYVSRSKQHQTLVQLNKRGNYKMCWKIVDA